MKGLSQIFEYRINFVTKLINIATETWKMTKFNGRKSGAVRCRDRRRYSCTRKPRKELERDASVVLEKYNSALCLHVRHLPNASKFGTIS